MGIEYRNGKPYYYRKKRKGDKIVSVYVGSGELAEIASTFDKEAQYEKNLNKQKHLKEEVQFQKMDKEVVAFAQIINELFTSVALANGYYKHKRQWRKKQKK
jgi:hypothetical protein